MNLERDDSLRFLSGGGEMGRLTRKKDWSLTAVGKPETWPQSLRSTVSIILNSRFPMFLFWGPELVCFYNDAYRPSLGNDGKHPHILGERADEYWKEIWHIIKPLIDQVLSGGDATWSEDQLIPIYRNGKIEDVYWTFSYSPVHDETGRPAGVFVTCTETTKKIFILQELQRAEQRSRNLINEAIVATSVFRGEKMLLEMANEAALKIWHKDRSIIGQPLLEFLPEMKDQPFSDLLQNVFKTGQTHSEEEAGVFIGEQGNKQLHYLDFSYKALKNESGEIYGVLFTGMDVTEKVQIRIKLEDSRNQLHFAIEAAELATWDYNPATGQFVSNNRLHEWFGLPIEKDIDLQDAINVVIEKDRERVKNTIKKALNISSQGQYSIEYTICNPLNKKERIVLAKGKAFFNEKNVAYRFSGTLQDITPQVIAQKKVEESERHFRDQLEREVQDRTTELHTMNRELKQMNQELKSFAYVASHDLQEPLRKIQTFSARIMEKEEQNLSDYGKNYFERMQSAARRMQTLIEDLLTYSRTNTAERNFEFIDLNELIQEVESEISEELQQQKVRLEYGKLATVRIVPFQFKQVLHNLISNSLKFSQTNQTPHIRITGEIVREADHTLLTFHKSYYHIKISDNGIGFDPQYKERIFEVFQRLHGKDEFTGTGIGLAIVKKIIENHNGYISATGEVNKGASFHIYIPYDPSSLD